MIYRHYKGNLYFVIGYVTRFSKDFPATRIEQIAIATHTETKEKIAVLVVHDKLTGSTYYASEELRGVHTFYKDTEGNHWLRPREMFFDNVSVIEENGTLRKATIHDEMSEVFETPRFEKVKGEYLFDVISETYKKK